MNIKVVDGAFNEVNLLKPGEHLVEVHLKALDYTAAASKEPIASFHTTAVLRNNTAPLYSV